MMSSPDPSTSSERARTSSANVMAASSPTSVATAARYRPLCLLGHGGMGSVEAVEEELDDGSTRVVALKRILRTAGTDASRLEMFLREARLTTLLSHPNVIRSLAFGESEGEVFLAMEYVAGEPLSRIISVAREHAQRLPLPVLAFILAEACEGLHAAHELRGPDGEPLGVVHRDVSPHNVMVGYDGTVKLLDFGVAKIDLVESTAKTKTGEVKGKTAYMSPEQAMGETVDRRSDLYSVGAVLYECVTGRRMWGSGTDFDVLRRLALEEPPQLAADTDRPAPPALAALHARLIERDRANRPATAHEVAMELRAYAGDTQTSDVHAAMDRLFEGERERREEKMRHALRKTNGTEVTAGSGESGPVFVTHRSEAAPKLARRSTGIAVALGFGALASAIAVVAYVMPRASEARVSATETPLAASPSGSVQPVHPATPTTTAPSELVQPAAVTSAAPAVVPTVPRSGTNASRRLAVPQLAPPRVAAAPPPSSAPVPPPQPKAPEPPDVDPTPF